jgi:hypothetical protein
MTDDTLSMYGGECKALGPAKVGGLLVRFGSPAEADVQGDFFTPATYYGQALKGRLDVVYHHGLGRVDDLANRLGNEIIGSGTIQLRDDGLWFEAELDTDKPDVKAVYAKASQGLLGWSSGSTERLVKREEIKSGITRIERWPLIEASLSPKPVDPRNRAVALKALLNDEQAPATGLLIDRAETLVADVEAVVGLLSKASEQRQAQGRHLSAAKREAVKALRDVLDELYDTSAPRPDSRALQTLKNRLLAARI